MIDYKTCAVPTCISTTIRTPGKLFLSVPKNIKIRYKWLQLAGRDPTQLKESTPIYFCEDHFDIEKDVANYRQYKMGLSQRLVKTDGVLPTKFYCQKDRRSRMSDQSSTSRPAFNKLQRTRVIQGSLDSQIQGMLSGAGTSNIQPTAATEQVYSIITESQLTKIKPNNLWL